MERTISFSKEEAERIYSDPGFAWIREQSLEVEYRKATFSNEEIEQAEILLNKSSKCPQSTKDGTTIRDQLNNVWRQTGIK